jgi:hypothetical protein
MSVKINVKISKKYVNSFYFATYKSVLWGNKSVSQVYILIYLKERGGGGGGEKLHAYSST